MTTADTKEASEYKTSRQITSEFLALLMRRDVTPGKPSG
jgi:hypothetical protein